jgi:hypothetical protein
MAQLKLRLFSLRNFASAPGDLCGFALFFTSYRKVRKGFSQRAQSKLTHYYHAGRNWNYRWFEPEYQRQ